MLLARGGGRRLPGLSFFRQLRAGFRQNPLTESHDLRTVYGGFRAHQKIGEPLRKIEREGPLMIMRLNRPEKRNAINRQMHLDLQEVCRELSEDFETRVVILAGEGAAFSSGADTSEWGQPGSAHGPPPAPHHVARPDSPR